MNNKSDSLLIVFLFLFIGLIIVCSSFEQELVQVIAPSIICFAIGGVTLYKIINDFLSRNIKKEVEEEV